MTRRLRISVVSAAVVLVGRLFLTRPAGPQPAWRTRLANTLVC
jgi:hypothetical protein